MKKLVNLTILLVIVSILLISGCKGSGLKQNSSNEEDNINGSKGDFKDFPKSIVIASGPIGGPWYSIITKISEILMREIPGLTVSVIEGGAESNLQLVNEGIDVHLGMTSSVAMLQCKNGSGELDIMDNVTAVMPISSSYIQTAVRADSNIKSFKDIVGKRISAGRIGFASEVIFRQILNAYGISYEDVKKSGGNVNMIGWSEYPSLMSDGHLDVICLNGEIPHNIFMQIEVDKPLRLLECDEEQKKIVLEKMPALFTKTFEAGCYKGVEEPIELFGYSGLLVANDRLSDEFLLKIMDLIQDSKEEIISELAFVDLLGWENSSSGMNELVCRPVIWEKIKEKSNSSR